MAAPSTTRPRRAGAVAEGVSYVVVGPVFRHRLEARASRRRGGRSSASSAIVAPTPVYAIGGASRPSASWPVLAAGAHGVAVRSAILAARDPARAARAFARRPVRRVIRQSELCPCAHLGRPLYDLRPPSFRPCFISCRVAASSTE